jgi:hypothetical protein
MSDWKSHLPMSKVLFPNLFIIGAMKAGTSSLHEYLHQHPQIYMSRFKEPQYFAPHSTRWGQKWGQGNPYPEPGMDWYLRLFADAGAVQYAGESSVSYSARPWMEDCEKRIYAFNPHARFIYILRDPIERAISHYWHNLREGREDSALLTAVKHDQHGYLARSWYSMQLRPYLDTFGSDRVHVLTLEELNENAESEFRKLFRWLGVDPNVTISTEERFNVSSPTIKKTRERMVFLDTMRKHWRWKLWEPGLPSFIPRLVERAAYHTIERKAVNCQPAIDYLRPILQRYTRDLSSLLGREFPEWRTLFPGASTTRNGDRCDIKDAPSLMITTNH